MFDGIRDLLNDKEHMKKQADAGNTAAMRILASLYREDGDLEQAIEWAHKAVDNNDSESLGLAALLHYERLLNRAAQMPAGAEGVFEDSDALISIIPIYMILLHNGTIKKDEQLSETLMKAAEFAYYCYSFMMYCGDKGKPIDIDKAIEMINTVPGTRAKLLYGAILAEKGQHKEAFPILEEGLRDVGYRDTDKGFMENMVYATAILYVSATARQNGNLERAVTIINNAISGIKDEDMYQDIKSELNKYQKKMLGGWKYVG